MRKLFLAVAALGMLATSCTKDDTSVVVAGDSLVSFEVSAPVIGTRADAYEIYGIGEAVEHLHYAVYLTEGTENAPEYKLVFTDCIEEAFAGDALKNTSLELKLVNDQTYTAIFWADDENAPYTFDAQSMTVTMDPSALAAQDEDLDAFFGHHKFVVAGPTVEKVTLNRPFSQLNIATADIAEAAAAGVEVDAETTTEIKVSGLYTTLNLLSEEVGGAMTELTVYNAAPKAEGKIGSTYEMLSMNYLLVNSRKLVDVTFDVETKAGQKVNRLFQNVPVERNYRTNILGNLFVDNIGFEVTINPIFDGVIPSTEAENLQLAYSLGLAEYTLQADAAFNTQVPYFLVESEFTVNGAGHMLTSGSATHYALKAIDEAAKLTVNDLNITSNGGGVAATYGAEVVFNGGKIYVDSPSTSGRYLFYTEGAGSTITINGGEFSWDKNDNQKRAYIYADAGTTVYVTGGTFGKASSRSGYTAGILGEGTVIITGGTFGFNPTKWVADGYFANKVGDNWVVSDERHVNTVEALVAELTSNKENIKVVLTADIDVPISSLGTITGGSGEYKLGGENTKVISIDLGGKKLNVTTTYWSNLGAKNNNATFTIKNGTMTSSQATGTWNSYDVTFSNCNYVIENVVFEKAIALSAANKNYTLKNVTINETHDYYAMWVEAVGQTVTIDGLTVNSAGRGIKIDEQYVGTPAKVTLNVANATFNTAKKAAIMVKSVAGAEINASNLNIANVAADSEFAVWVDSDAEAHADKVVVNGAYVKVEGQAAAIVNNAADLSTALTANAKVYLADGEYTLATFPAGATIVGNGDNVTLNVQNKAFGVHGDVTIENAKLVFSNANYKGFQHTNVASYKNCTIEGQPFLYGEKVVFDNCTFEQTSAGAYNVWTYGAKNVTFNGCTFNSAGKSVLVYCETASLNQVVTFNDCVLNASAPADGKAAIEIDSSLVSGYTVNINNTTANGFANGNVSGSSLWNHKKGSKAVVNVDGVKVN